MILVMKMTFVERNDPHSCKFDYAHGFFWPLDAENFNDPIESKRQENDTHSTVMAAWPVVEKYVGHLSRVSLLALQSYLRSSR